MNARLGGWAGIFAGVLLSAGAAAAPLTIVATPTEVSGGFLHNLFHSASKNGGAGGSIYAWLDLDTTQLSTWDPDTGDLTLYLEVFSDSSLTTSQGYVTATSTDLLGANLSGQDAQDGGVLGSINWDFDAAALAYMQGLDAGISDNTSQTYIDHKYSDTTLDGYQPNSFDSKSVTLWGADTAALIGSGPNFDVNATTFGTDLVFEVIPVPGAVWLFASALGLLGWIRRATA